MLLVVCAEVIVVAWFYGLDKFCAHIKEMNGFTPYLNWRLSWRFVCPLALLVIVVLDIMFFAGLSYGDYVYPFWAILLGYALNALALLPIPAYALYYHLRYFRRLPTFFTVHLIPFHPLFKLAVFF